MWASGIFALPTYRQFEESFDDWLRREGLERRFVELRKKGMLEKPAADASAVRRIHRLTENGRIAVQGGRDPEACWKRPWDGRWRVVLFDVPASKTALRYQLWRFLRLHHFGYLQNSVWITPDPVDAMRERIGTEKARVGALTLLEARPCGGETDADIVAEAWDFPAINRLYRQHLLVLGQMPKIKSGLTAWRQWVGRERKAWQQALKADPLLPDALLPAGYLGKQAWGKRRRLLGTA